MKFHGIWLGLMLGVLAGPAYAADNALGSVVCFATTTTHISSNLYPCVPLILNGDGGMPTHISGTLPAFAATPTVNLGTLNGVALDTSVQSLLTKLNAGLTVSWSGQSVTLAGTLPAFAATPTVNLGTIGTAATETTLAAVNSKLGAALPLPTGAATETTLAAVNTKLGLALPLPTGAATSANQSTAITALQTLATASASQATAANQTTGNGSLSTIVTNTTGIATAANQTATQANPGSDATKAIAVQGVTSGKPLTTADNNGAAFSSAVALTAGGASDSVGRSVEMLVTVAGNVSLQMSGSPHVISVAASPYTQTFPYAITAINSSGTTATATYANLH